MTGPKTIDEALAGLQANPDGGLAEMLASYERTIEVLNVLRETAEEEPGGAPMVSQALKTAILNLYYVTRNRDLAEHTLRVFVATCRELEEAP